MESLRLCLNLITSLDTLSPNAATLRVRAPTSAPEVEGHSQFTTTSYDGV